MILCFYGSGGIMSEDLFSLKCLSFYFSSCPTLALVNYTWENNNYWPKSMVCRVCVYHLCISQHFETCQGDGIGWLWEAVRCSQTLSQIWMWFWVHNFSWCFIVGMYSKYCVYSAWLDWRKTSSQKLWRFCWLANVSKSSTVLRNLATPIVRLYQY